MGNTQHFGGRAAEGVGGTRRKQLVNRDSLQMGEQSWLRHYRENNPGLVSYLTQKSQLHMCRGGGGSGVIDEEQLNPTQLQLLPW